MRNDEKEKGARFDREALSRREDEHNDDDEEEA